MIRINLLPPEMRKSQLAVRRIVVLVTFAISSILLALYTYDYLLVRSLERTQQQIQEKQYLLKPSSLRQAEITQKLQRLAQKNEILVSVSKTNTSWHAVLIHLGDLVTENIWLRAVSINENHELLIKGSAIHYQDLAMFLQKFEQDTLLKDAALITSSTGREETTQTEVIEFEVSANFRGR